jgi:hypothetical protein
MNNILFDFTCAPNFRYSLTSNLDDTVELHNQCIVTEESYSHILADYLFSLPFLATTRYRADLSTTVVTFLQVISRLMGKRSR